MLHERHDMFNTIKSLLSTYSRTSHVLNNNCSFYLWQKQQTRMQEVLRQLGQQHKVQSKETQQSPIICSSGSPPEEGDINKQIASSGYVC